MKDTTRQRTVDSALSKSGKQNSSAADGGDQGEEQAEVMRGLVTCVLGVVGVSVLIWLILFLLLSPNGTTCTGVRSAEELIKQLGPVVATSANWKPFAEELGLTEKQLQDLALNHGDIHPSIILDVARFWFHMRGDVCWEMILAALVKIDEQRLAGLLAQAYYIDFTY